jgi:electron transfer flavoprotein beta subunit
MIKPSYSVAVLISPGRNPVSGASRAAPGDVIALSLGRKIAGDALRVVFAGSPEEKSLGDYLAYGAGKIEAVECPEGTGIAPLLVGALRGVDLIITGSQAETGLGSGLLPYALAAALKCAVIANVLDARLDRDELHLTQFLPKGQRRNIAGRLPAVIVAHPKAPSNLRYAYARRQSGRIVPVCFEPPSAEALISIKDASWTALPAPRRMIPLKVEMKQSAHERLRSAISQEAKGGIVVIDGSSVDKAQVVLDYLRENQVIDI